MWGWFKMPPLNEAAPVKAPQDEAAPAKAAPAVAELPLSFKEVPFSDEEDDDAAGMGHAAPAADGSSSGDGAIKAIGPAKDRRSGPWHKENVKGVPVLALAGAGLAAGGLLIHFIRCVPYHLAEALWHMFSAQVLLPAQHLLPNLQSDASTSQPQQSGAFTVRQTSCRSASREALFCRTAVGLSLLPDAFRRRQRGRNTAGDDADALDEADAEVDRMLEERYRRRRQRACMRYRDGSRDWTDDFIESMTKGFHKATAREEDKAPRRL